MAAAHVLVVDDDRSIRRTLEKLLAGEGYSVTTAADGPAALESYRAADLVLLDLGLPEIDGLTVLETMRDASRDSSARRTASFSRSTSGGLTR